MQKYVAQTAMKSLTTMQPEDVKLFKQPSPTEAEFTGPISDFIVLVEDEYECSNSLNTHFIPTFSLALKY
jgi:hypothetical protein